MAGLMGVREAARAINVNASTITRYLRQHPELNRGGAGRPLVDLDELKRHRTENVNAVMSGNHGGRLLGEPPAVAPPPEPEPEEHEDERRSIGPRKPSYADAKTVAEATRARLAQLELARRLKQVVSRAEVEQALLEAGQTLRQLLAARARSIAEDLSALNDPREITARLDEEDRACLERIADALASALESGADAAAAA